MTIFFLGFALGFLAGGIAAYVDCIRKLSSIETIVGKQEQRR